MEVIKEQKVMEGQIFMHGPHKDKSFAYVYDNDQKYCKDVLLGQRTTDEGNLDDFKVYLQDRYNSMKEDLTVSFTSVLTVSESPIGDSDKDKIRCISGKRFVHGFQTVHRECLNKLVRTKIMINEVHESSTEKKTNCVLGIFYKLFLNKLFFHAKNIDCYSKTCCGLLTIFPIELKFDSKWKGKESTMKTRLSILECLFDNEPFAETVQDIILYMSRYSFHWNRHKIKYDIEHMLTSINNSHLADGDQEPNLLLDVTFFNNNPHEYMTLLKRYLLFYEMCKCSYLHSLKSRNRPYTFTVVQPDQLADCESIVFDYRQYVTYGGHVTDIAVLILRLSTFICRKNFPDKLEDDCTTPKDIDYTALQHMTEYVKKLVAENSGDRIIVSPSTSLTEYVKHRETNNQENGKETEVKDIRGRLIELAATDDESRNFEIDKCFLKFTLIYYSNGKLVDMSYSDRVKNKMCNFYRLILTASLLNVRCKQLVVYNPRLGQETYINMIKNKEDIKNFIRQYRHPDAWKDVPLLGHLI